MKIGKERDEQDMGDQWNGTLQYRMGERTTKIEERDGVVFLTYDLFREAGVTHAVSTRIGGVSQGYLSEMNLSFTRETIRHVWRRITGVLRGQSVIRWSVWFSLTRFTRRRFIVWMRMPWRVRTAGKIGVRRLQKEWMV